MLSASSLAPEEPPMMPDERLDRIEQDIGREANALGLEGQARRQFIFFGLVAAAAGAFGAGRQASGQTAAAGAPSTAPTQAAQPAPPARYPLGNGEPMAWTFQPYPGGTGALL